LDCLRQDYLAKVFRKSEAESVLRNMRAIWGKNNKDDSLAEGNNPISMTKDYKTMPKALNPRHPRHPCSKKSASSQVKIRVIPSKNQWHPITNQWYPTKKLPSRREYNRSLYSPALFGHCGFCRTDLYGDCQLHASAY
jgi:hypothetical protein